MPRNPIPRDPGGGPRLPAKRFQGPIGPSNRCKDGRHDDCGGPCDCQCHHVHAPENGTGPLGLVTERCSAHGDFRCDVCLYQWCVDTGRKDLAHAIRTTAVTRGPRGGNGSLTFLSLVNRAWGEYVAANGGHK